MFLKLLSLNLKIKNLKSIDGSETEWKQGKRQQPIEPKNIEAHLKNRYFGIPASVILNITRRSGYVLSVIFKNLALKTEGDEKSGNNKLAHYESVKK